MIGQEALNNFYRDTQVAVLGASGFIGRWVARALCAQGARVHLIVRNKNIARKIFAQYRIEGDIIEADLKSAGSIGLFFRERKPAITFNLAGYGVDRGERDETMCYRINADLVEATCEAIAEVRDPKWQGQNIVHVGTALEYGSIPGNLSEDSAPHPTTVYGKSKLAGTGALKDCCKALGINGLTARLFTVYGPGEQSGRLLPALVEAARTGKPLPLTAGKQKRDFTYVEDVTAGLLRLGIASSQPGEIINLATGRLTSVRHFAETAAGILGIPKEQLIFGAIPTREEEMEHDEIFLERLRQLIAWVPPTLIEDGIRETLNFEARCAQAASATLAISRV